MSSDGIRGYIRALREGRDKSQREVAEAGGMARRTYEDWETGATDEIKSGPLIRMIRFLDGSFDALRLFADNPMTTADGARVAEEWLRKQPQDIQDQIAAIQSAPLDEHQETTRILQRLAELTAQGVSLKDAMRIVESE